MNETQHDQLVRLLFDEGTDGVIDEIVAVLQSGTDDFDPMSRGQIRLLLCSRIEELTEEECAEDDVA